MPLRHLCHLQEIDNLIRHVSKHSFQIQKFLKILFLLFFTVNKEFVSATQRGDHELTLVIHINHYVFLKFVF